MTYSNPDTGRYISQYNEHLIASIGQTIKWMQELRGNEVLLCWEPYLWESPGAMRCNGRYLCSDDFFSLSFGDGYLIPA